MTVLVAGCAVTRTVPPEGSGSQIALTAIALVGVPYRYGGEDPATGMDCSGLVRYVVRGTLGFELPRQAEAMSRIGTGVEPAQLRPGDLVFFDTLGRPYSHVGVYLGDGQFVHAPTQRGQVRIERLSQPYWASRYNGARRLDESTEGSPRMVRTGRLVDPAQPVDADAANAAKP
jgi:cell wall-associated NlpC family hydrolase